MREAPFFPRPLITIFNFPLQGICIQTTPSSLLETHFAYSCILPGEHSQDLSGNLLLPAGIRPSLPKVCRRLLLNNSENRSLTQWKPNVAYEAFSFPRNSLGDHYDLLPGPVAHTPEIRCGDTLKLVAAILSNLLVGGGGGSTEFLKNVGNLRSCSDGTGETKLLKFTPGRQKFYIFASKRVCSETPRNQEKSESYSSMVLLNQKALLRLARRQLDHSIPLSNSAGRTGKEGRRCFTFFRDHSLNLLYWTSYNN